VAAAGTLALAAGACPLTGADGAPLQGEGVQAAWAVEGDAPLRAGQPFVLRVRTCPDGAVLQRVDATMPAHRHGMNYRPRIEPLGPGRWRVEGLLWHMAGLWELQFDLRTGDRTQTLRQAVELP
jgi:hypothetical protein